jgi:hypothetical protein
MYSRAVSHRSKDERRKKLEGEGKHVKCKMLINSMLHYSFYYIYLYTLFASLTGNYEITITFVGQVIL